ncbi:MAG: hypothetical protein MJZ05_02625 [Fibrobacter sp.]|nr:hypothetical protein [Fibrobacter sp.]
MKYLGLLFLLPTLLLAQVNRDGIQEIGAAADSVDVTDDHPYIRYPYANEGLLSYWFDGWSLNHKEVDGGEILPYLLENEKSRSYARAANVVGWTGTAMVIVSPLAFFSSLAFLDFENGGKSTPTSRGMIISSGVMLVVGFIMARSGRNFLLSKAVDRYNDY